MSMSGLGFLFKQGFLLSLMTPDDSCQHLPSPTTTIALVPMLVCLKPAILGAPGWLSD